MAFRDVYSGTSYAFNISPVDPVTQSTLEKIILFTWDPSEVGIGRDAQNLNHDDVKITDIKKVQNGALLASYHKLRAELQRKKQTSVHKYGAIGGIPNKLAKFNMEERLSDVNEVYLFHGTDEDAVMNIVKEGFNPKATNPKSLYGQGVYFAEEFTKADQYTDEKYDREPPGTELTVLLCRVLLGNFYKCAKQEAEKCKVPPCIKCLLLKKDNCACGPQDRYDSILGSGPGMLYREFVVYNGAQCYPEFIIKYERIGGERTSAERI